MSNDCVICGVDIEASINRWMGEFRALYTRNLDWPAIRLSGIGLRSYPEHYLAPRDVHSRYDDADIDQEDMVDISQESNWSARPLYGIPPDLDPGVVWGLLFHAACWDLASKLLDPMHMSNEQLFQILKSMEKGALGRLRWESDWTRLPPAPQDLLRRADSSPEPMPEALGRERGVGDILMESYERPIYISNPLDVPELLVLRNESLTSPHQHSESQIFAGNVRAEHDIFHKLPVEILHLILSILPSKDVLNLKIASSIVAVTQLPEMFWASRFAFGHEFEWIIEVRDFRAGSFSWRGFYYGVRDLPDTMSLQNRRRISHLIISFRDFLSNYRLAPCSGTPRATFFEPNEEIADNESWITASPYRLDPNTATGLTQSVLRVRQVHIPHNLKAVFVSFVNFFGRSCLSGLRFQCNNDTEIALGYIHPEHEHELKSVSLKGEDRHFDVYGFVLALDYGGFGGISLLTSDDETEWVGRRGRCKRRLTAGSCTRSLKASFDAMKLLSLEVTEDTSSPNPLSLREKAWWKPDIPPEGVSFHEFPIVEMGSDDMYYPHGMFLFGGRHGEHLPKLIRIGVRVIKGESLVQIDFEYKSEVEGELIHTMGRRSRIISREGLEINMQEASFDIDGPGGEKINTVHVFHGGISYWGLRLRTNHDREFDTPFRHEKSLMSFLPDISGKEIIGFYTPSYSLFKSIGVISRDEKS